MTQIQLDEEKVALMNQEESQVEAKKEKELQVGWPHVLLFILYFLGIGLVTGFLLGIYQAITSNNVIDQLLKGYNSLIFDAIVFFVALVTFKRMRTFVLSSFSLAPLKSWRTYAYIFAGVVIFATTQYVLLELWAVESATRQETDLGVATVTTISEQLLFLLAVVVLTPIKEEILFRGIIHRFLEVRHHYILGLVISSLIFGVIHFGFPISATIMGLTLVILYKLTRSLVPSIILHMIWNMIASIGILMS